MSATHRNPDVSNTAARYVAKAIARVHPAQRADLLRDMIAHADDALAIIQDVPEGRPGSFFGVAREVVAA